MKLDNILDTASRREIRTLVNEGLRFGRKEMKIVDQEYRDILVGIEYEFIVDDDLVDDTNGYGSAYDRMMDDVARTKNRWLDEATKEEMDEYNVQTITNHLKSFRDEYVTIDGRMNDLKKLYDNIGDWKPETIQTNLGFDNLEELDTFVNIVRLIYSMSKTFVKIFAEVGDIEYYDGLDRIVWVLDWNSKNVDNEWGYFVETVEKFTEIDSISNVEKIIDIGERLLSPQNDMSGLSNEISQISQDVAELVEFITEIKGDIDYVIDMYSEVDGLSGDDTDWDNQIHDIFKKSIEEEHWDDMKVRVLGFNPDEGLPDEYMDDVQDNDRLEFVRMRIESMAPDLATSIDDIKDDTSLGEMGVEFITFPENLHDAIDTMSEAFRVIEEIGSTDDSTGMHVNMSLRDAKITRRNFNPTKMMFLLDESFVMAKYRPTGSVHVDKFIVGFEKKKLWELAHARNEKALLLHFEDIVVNTNKKSQSVNFLNTYLEQPWQRESDRRIEFRYFGGPNYHDRFEELRYDIYKAAYIFMVAFTEGFGRKEYLKNVVKFLEHKSEEFYGMDFTRLSKEVTKYDTYEEFVERQ